MSRRRIELEVTFRAVVRGGDEYIPEHTAAEETVTLTMPAIDTKYVVLPKLLEGVTLRAIQTLQGNVSSYLGKKADEERKRKEFEQLRMAYPHADEEQLEPAEGDDLPFDEMESDDSEGDDESSETEPAELDFEAIAKDAAAALNADGVEVTYVPATGRNE